MKQINCLIKWQLYTLLKRNINPRGRHSTVVAFTLCAQAAWVGITTPESFSDF